MQANVPEEAVLTRAFERMGEVHWQCHSHFYEVEVAREQAVRELGTGRLDDLAALC